MALIETLLNHYLALDPLLTPELEKYQGKILQIELSEPELYMTLFPGSQGIQIQGNYHGPVDTLIQTSLAGLLQLNGKQQKTVLAKKEARLQGDLELGENFQQLFRNMQIDPEEILSHLCGDVMAHKLGYTERQLETWHGLALKRVTENAREFLQYENRILVSREELESFLQSTDTLRADHDRLQARIERLKANLTQPANPDI